MGKDTLSCLEKRDLLNQPAVSVDTLQQWGKSFEDGGFVYDAVDFYEKAKAKDALARLLKGAEKEGNFFLFNRVSRILGYEPGREEWLLLAKNAETCGNYAFAGEAYRRAGEEELAERCSVLVYGRSDLKS